MDGKTRGGTAGTESTTTARKGGLRRLFPWSAGERTVNRSAGAKPGVVSAPASAPPEPAAPAPAPAPASAPPSATATTQAAAPAPPSYPAPFTEEGELSPSQVRFNRAAAAREDVISDVHKQDFIYRFCCSHPLLNPETAADYYFTDGSRSARKFVDLVKSFDDLDPRSVDVLEFASGYGCVSRHLKKYNHLNLTASDIHVDAVSFLREALGMKCVLSNSVPEALDLPRSYDVIFVLSLFSHLPQATFGRWLRVLYESLNAPGYLAFTTHGLKSCVHMGVTPADIPEEGIWFRAGSEQNDLDTAEYGSTITTPDFVIREIYQQTGAPIVAYRHGGWWEHQDLWVIKRTG